LGPLRWHLADIPDHRRKDRIMRKRITSLVVAGLAVAAAGMTPGVAAARHGADDAAGHIRHARHAHDATQRTARRGRGADDGAGHARRGRGADDGPNHR
jgi:hypothetical protein